VLVKVFIKPAKFEEQAEKEREEINQGITPFIGAVNLLLEWTN